MLNPQARLTIYDGYNEVEHTDIAADFSRNPFDLNIPSNNYLYVGFYKPIGAIFVEMHTPSMYPSEMAIQYNNGTSYVAAEPHHDDTRGFSRSGFIQWTKSADWAQSTENGEQLYWIRLGTSIAVEETVVWGINIVFCDDQDLVNECPTIMQEKFLQGDSSFIRRHVAARDQIVQTLRNKDVNKIKDNKYINLTAWDLLDIDEVKQGAKFLALSKIFFDASDQPGDAWAQKSAYYEHMYEKQMKLARLTIDQNDDGLTQEPEKKYSLRTMTRYK